jgi:asparagine synthase (glutamine-hydrolysing)
MCGILGVVSTDGRVDRGTFERSLSFMAHRGPDGEGCWYRPGTAAPFVALGHRRLAIIDLSEAGAQPMANADASVWITYNGEIYNYVELMTELQALGHTFRSKSDTEVILRAYEQWGAAALERLNGMFAFAIWDERKRELFAARDRFGEKPFHYAWDPRTGFLAFASEIKALIALPQVDATLDEQALYRFVAWEELAGSEQTLWRGVRRLPRASWLRLKAGEGAPVLTTGRYWDIDLRHTDGLSFERAAIQFAETFADSVRLRLRSDVPVGTSLSGGLDSSAVVCQIHALGAAGGQRTFSARMSDPKLDEGRHIQAVLAKTHVRGHDVWPSNDELGSVFAKLCYHLEEPFQSTSQFAQFLVMRLASEHGVTVLLDGQGADELMAGYPPYFIARYADLAQQWRLLDLAREWQGFRARHQRPFPLPPKALAARMAPGLYRLARRSEHGLTAAGTGAWAQMAPWWNPSWLAEFPGEPAPRAGVERDRLTQKLYDDSLNGALQELLRYGDRNSMAWSRELRQPFLDHRLAEQLFRLPPEFKLRNGETKVIMRAAMKPLLPESITVRQDKLGYQPPQESWMDGPLAAWTADRLDSAASVFDGRLAPGAVDRLRSLARPLAHHQGRAVFTLLTLGECWRELRNVRTAVRD